MRPPIPDQRVHLMHQTVFARLDPVLTQRQPLITPRRKSALHSPSLSPLRTKRTGTIEREQPLHAIVVDRGNVLVGRHPVRVDVCVVNGVVGGATIAHSDRGVDPDSLVGLAAGK